MGNMGFDPKRYLKGEWLKGEDLEEGERMVVTIKAAYEHTFAQSGDVQPVLEFAEIEQKLTLNKTRIRKLVELFGDETETWIDQKIALYSTEVQYSGKTVLSVAIAKVPAKGVAKKMAAATPDVEFMTEAEEA